MFSIEMTRNGKPNIVFKNHKYRESYSLKTGEIVWRCLGRTCGASIKTDADRKTVTVAQSKHTGPHPVTLRRLSSSSPRTASPTAPSTPAPDTPTRPDTPPQLMTPAVSPSRSGPGVTDLVAENSKLRDRVLELNEQLKCVLDHSIENDTRLLQYTDQVFAANTTTSAADCGVQCDLPSDCRDQRCAETRDLVGSLRTTIEVLEAELLCLKEEATRWRCGGEGPEWTVVSTKRPTIVTENMFQVLTTVPETSDLQQPATLNINKENPRPKGRQKKKRRQKTTLAQQNPPKTSLSFSSITIDGDSHSRGLAGLVRRMVDRRTLVEGSCKPGAKLLSVTSDSTPPAGACCIIIAGTNDVAAGQQNNIYQHLEGRITSKLRTAGVVVSTLPHRHDLPATHPVNLETARVNSYIEELCVRHRGTEVLDFNLIGRYAFTPHGMHLKQQHKHLLAELLLGCVRRLDQLVPASTAPSSVIEPPPAVTCEPPSAAFCGPPSVRPTSPTVGEARSLPFETFAEAVKSQLPTQHIVQKNCLFLKNVKIG